MMKCWGRACHMVGLICSSRPWEVIVCTVALVITLSCSESSVKPLQPIHHCHGNQQCQEFKMIDAILMTAIRCVAVLYSYYQLSNLHRLGSKYILGLAGLFIGFSSLVFSSSIINCLQGDISDLKDALFLFLLLIDLSKATLLAQLALKASNQEEVRANIARGMELVGPSVTLDTLVETLVISIGTLSGIHRLEVLCYYAYMSVIVNYVLFMTFFPACLSLILEIFKPSINFPDSIEFNFNNEQNEKANPVVQKVKIVMSLGLVIVHVQSRWMLNSVEEEVIMPLVPSDHLLSSNGTDNKALQGYLIRLLTINADHIVLLILLVALTVIFAFFEDKRELLTGKVTSKDVAILCKEETEHISGKNHDSNNDTYDCISLGTSEVEERAEIKIRSLKECMEIFKQEGFAENLSDEEVLCLMDTGEINAYQLEKVVNNPERGVGLRRKYLGRKGKFFDCFQDIPYKNYPYNKVLGVCCENVIGILPVPLGMAGPLLLDGKEIYIPMATTEGCLVASMNRGCRALQHNGVNSCIVSDGMTRGPVVRFQSAVRASDVMIWLKKEENFLKVKQIFDSTSRFARLQRIQVNIASRCLYLRFVASTGDAMGMNMVSKGTEIALKHIQSIFLDMEILSLSGNFCADKKPAAVNWIEGRGKSVVCEAIIPSNIIEKILKTTVKAIVDVNTHKNLVGSAMSGSIGGFNAHAANTVTAIYIATGQDPAQNVGSSNCITQMEPWGENDKNLYISCTMPSLEIGTVGGGTQLPTQAACLDMLGVKGPNREYPGENAKLLARIVCAAVLAGELSLMGALAAGHLVSSHLRHNRSSASVNGTLK